MPSIVPLPPSLAMVSPGTKAVNFSGTCIEPQCLYACRHNFLQWNSRMPRRTRVAGNCSGYGSLIDAGVLRV